MNITTEKLLLIGEVEKLSGISIRTIRYYESLNLIKPIKRTSGGFRQFSADILTRLTFIKRAQNLGLTLEEINNILTIYDQGSPPCAEIRERLTAKIKDIDEQIQQLLSLQNELNLLLSDWQDLEIKPEGKICPFVQ
ncbi:heavy metal-responsive transcriptional regulator [Cyanobacterium aponinum UTEX 3222]|uniref:heavy metal-responsive transcriptional regulator n=1 Tax=Cyanobacterium aponinum TaxID=379064 RepID=UPI002B4C1056|nr:heavy metal-responsive transcriptional regulator [Cyanobacterium aponinum]WRL37592.1 heavy metal-responsive transcriptional regulator [Cyanobacterium aponinum UTEX 3221]WRL41159.1 heavy metal-responsive transcriptional regulator [Cyanobacterium aponinum UTEX 3222]